MSATGTAHRRASMPRQPLAMPGYLPSIGFDGTLLDGHAVADLAAAGGPLAQRTPFRNDHRSDGETCCRRVPSATAVHVTVDGFVRDPRHRNAPAAATGRSAVSTNRHQVWHRPSPPTPHSRPACSLSDAAPARTQPYRQPAPVCGAATIADDVPRHRRRESTTLDVGLHHGSPSHQV